MLRVFTVGGKLVKVDGEDWYLVEGKSWCLNKGCRNHTWYLMNGVRVGRRVRKDYLHGLVAGARSGDRVDFVTRDTLDCRRGNLRLNGRRLISRG